MSDAYNIINTPLRHPMRRSVAPQSNQPERALTPQFDTFQADEASSFIGAFFDDKPIIQRSPEKEAAFDKILDAAITERQKQQAAVAGQKRKCSQLEHEGVVFCKIHTEREEPARKKQWTDVEFYLRSSHPCIFLEQEYISQVVEQVKKIKIQDVEQSSHHKQTTLQERALRFSATDKTKKYDAMKKSRAIERKKAISDGLISHPDAPIRLEEAVDFKGTCKEMCSQYEMLERQIQNNIDPMELNEHGEMDSSKMVKVYRRSAAGNDQPLPSDVRSPETLSRTIDYLFGQVLSNNSLEKCHAFIRDRTRAIRQDFTRQNIRDIRAVNAFEKIARFHIMCIHEMANCDEGKFSHQQEIEQLQKVLISLMEFYDDLRLENINTRNEAEFRAYQIIAHIRDQDVLCQTMSLPLSLFKHPHIQLALKFHSLSQRNNEIKETATRKNKPPNIPAAQCFYTQFFKLVANQETPYLMACLLESHFAEVRKGALKAMNVAYVHKCSGVPASDLKRILQYDSLKHLLEEAKMYGLVVDESLKEPTIRFGQKHYKNKLSVFREPLTNPHQRRSQVVDFKKLDISIRNIINGV